MYSSIPDHCVHTDQLSDEALVQAIVDGTMGAMETLYQRYKVLSYSLSFRMVSDHQVAENLTQEAFTLVWLHASTYAAQTGTVRTWLLTIVHHRTIDYLRMRRRRCSLEEVHWDTVKDEEQPTQPDVFDAAWRSILGTQVRAALLTIPAEQRKVIELAYFQGWTHAEIAKENHIPLGTVKARMRLGLHHLKQALAVMGVNEP